MALLKMKNLTYSEKNRECLYKIQQSGLYIIMNIINIFRFRIKQKP